MKLKITNIFPPHDKCEFFSFLRELFPKPRVLALNTRKVAAGFDAHTVELVMTKDA